MTVLNFFTHSLLAIVSGEMFAHVSQLFSKYFCLFLFYPLSFGISGGFSDNLESFLVILGVECNLPYLCVLSAGL